MSEFINTIDVLGDDVVMDSIIDKSITEFKDNALTTIGAHAFHGCASLTDVDLPNLETINGEGTFKNCSALSSLNIPSLTMDYIPKETFYNCAALQSFDFTNMNNVQENAFRGSGLTSVYLPGDINATRWGPYCFAECKSLVSVSAPTSTVIYWSYTGQFQDCTALKNVDMPNMTEISRSCFSGCTALEEISLPALVEVSDSAFAGCTMLKNVDFPLLAEVGGNMFGACTSLELLDLPSVTSIAGRAFQNSPKFAALVLRTETLASLANVDAFKGTPFMGTSGTVFVPRSLVESYKTATNWSTLYNAGTCNFAAIEDVTVDGTITGELKKCNSITLNATELTFTDTNSQTLTPTFNPEPPYVNNIVWKSSDTVVAKVSDGIVTPMYDGTTTITVTCGNASATCAVTVNVGRAIPNNILEGIGFNSGYLNSTGDIKSATSDVNTDKFIISDYAGSSIEVQLIDVTGAAANSRICYYDANETFISAVNGAAGSGCVSITSTVPENAAYAAISIAQNNNFSIEIIYNDLVIGSVEYIL